MEVQVHPAYGLTISSGILSLCAWMQLKHATICGVLLFTNALALDAEWR